MKTDGKTDETKRILVLTSTFPRFEADHTPPFVYELSKRLATSFDVLVLAPYGVGARKDEQCDGMTIHRFNYWPFPERVTDGAMLPALKRNRLLWLQLPFFLLFQLAATIRMIRRFNPHYIHAHWVVPQGAAAVLARFLTRSRCKIVNTSHGADLNGLRSLDGLKRFFLNRCDYATAVSKELRQLISDIGVRPSLECPVIPMGADSANFTSSADNGELKKQLGLEGEVLLFVGRLSEKKGIEYLIKAMPDILGAHPKARLLIIGSGELEKGLKELARRTEGAEGSILFLGPKPNRELPQYLAVADMFVGPSIVARDGDCEGAPVVLVESMLSGCLTLASDLPTIDATIEDKVTGYRFKSKDPQAISDCVLHALNNPQEAEAIRKRGQQYARDNFSWDVCGERYKQIFFSLQ
ncbi:GDP-mannose-dependent alpha-(1-6)-phosphatidylinositol monomannoside mannosyltransferase [Pseudodesulfovibrio hydrargyri]|uniref:GDP-mannose-dependent alpha-(1-6)-phosphatidylinositol monomannoside mannosyltransferase n=1 Tax=Pseudodesulfovibrio hydrargyri TaxID=2125990 RepID=A0A1J5MSQ8_9BACT|nr:glycosyltransferase family 4 protein [Pseudodesulfovibrio hydrargyri]OIQ48908.1 GDP-mannose-dependent alpha-(1-6)-phosphatidylinositol monomannoside mannosyltransferase [Pseudodesulfovibrio hydrargyri]